MKCRIMHEARGRMRIRAVKGPMALWQADIFENYLKKVPGVTGAKVYERTGDAVIYYSAGRDAVIQAVSSFSYERNMALLPEHSGRSIAREYEDKIFDQVALRLMGMYIFPLPVNMVYALCRNASYIWKAVKVLAGGKIEVAVLDAAAITVSMARGDLATANSIMFLLKLGETIEEWTQKKSVADLAEAMSLGVDRVWKIKDGIETLVPIGSVKAGDLISVRTGDMIPLDGRVADGEAMVNQSYITGESDPVHRTGGSYVYAGTVVDAGSIKVEVARTSGSGKYDRIVRMIEESEKLKSRTEDKAAHLADHLVPWSLLGTVLTYAVTRNATKAVSILMVDFSCALKLSMPLAVLSAIREAGTYNIAVKGGVFMETVSEAETIVFDKTGTLTKAEPVVTDIIPFGGNDPVEMLGYAACLEEHYPHSIARAVVKAAEEKAPHAGENHSEVEYVVAHGIVSDIDGMRALIGSYHFVFEEENCVIPEGEEEKFNALTGEYSKLYFALGGELAAVICIEDPVKEEAGETIRQLHKEGFSKVVMMTGDNNKNALLAAGKLGLDEVYSEVLPEDKAAYIKREHEAGRKVVMVGDGVNDTPALSEADVGVAINSGAAIAREVADINIGSDELYSLVRLRRLSNLLMDRINYNYRFIMCFNSALILLGAAGVLAPSASALLHNTSTIAISLRSMTDLEPDKVKKALPSGHKSR